jgi:hypothetical protein
LLDTTLFLTDTTKQKLLLISEDFMRRIFFLFLATNLLTAFAFSQDNRTPPQPTIVVTGTAELMVPPDEVVFTLDVTKRNKDMQIAKRDADQALAKIIDLTKRFNIKPQNVKTDYISVDAKYQSIRDPKNRIYDEDGDEIGTRVFLGYDVSTTVIVRMTELARFEDFFAEVIKTGLSEVEAVNFESSKIIEQRKEVRTMAMKAAYEKASAMAGAINQTIGKAISITEGTAEAGRYAFANGALANSVNISTGPVTVSQSVATFSPGAIKVTSQVTVTFLLN